ncbi:MAG TPA: hypothetical protein VEK15_19730 [Vicinamibacteria bacterium]|nr:hypothetical protein [Vicinamibacteria bacterium]
MAHHDTSDQIGSLDSRGVAVPLLALAVTVSLSAALFESFTHAVLFFVMLGVFSLPGLPVARLWFSGVEAWLVGAALGYLASSLAASVLVTFELLHPLALLLCSAALFVLARSVFRPLEQERSRRELPWVAACFVAVGLLVALPYSHVGTEVPEGFAYRAYFSADLMTHLSVVSELQKGAFPPVNPFYAGDFLAYYWLFFIFPAAVGEWTSSQGALLSLALASGQLFAGLLFCAMRRAGLPRSRAFLATLVAIAAASFDGVLVLLSPGAWTNSNVDAFGRWALESTSLDGLHRSILYTPQHLFSYSLLVILIALVLEGKPRDRRAAVLCGILLGGMAGTSIVSAMLAGPWLVLLLLLRKESFREFLVLSGTATTVALLFFGWYFAIGFFSGAATALTLRLPQVLELISVPLIDCGALLLLLLFRRELERIDGEIAALAVLALAAVFFVDLTGYEGVWMAWRAGSVLLVSLGLLAGRALAGPLRLGQVAILAIASLTVGLDVFNAQDVSNRSLSPGGFRWTTVVSRGEREALEWLRRETPTESMVQWDVRARDPGEWAFVPALAERRMAVGFPIFLLDVVKYRARERRRVRPIFTSGDAAEAHRLARELGIDYIFIGAAEVRTRGERVRALIEASNAFRPVYENEEVSILEVVSH